MVDSIKGSGSKIIIIKPKPKSETDPAKKTEFADKLREKGGVGGPEPRGDRFTTGTTGLAQGGVNPAIYQQQQVQRLQRLEEIARQIREGTYKIVDAGVLADKLIEVFTDRRSREKWVKKMLVEHKESLSGLSGQALGLGELELKKMVQMVKDAVDEPFDDPELESLIKEYT